MDNLIDLRDTPRTGTPRYARNLPCINESVKFPSLDDFLGGRHSNLVNLPSPPAFRGSWYDTPKPLGEIRKTKEAAHKIDNHRDPKGIMCLPGTELSPIEDPVVADIVADLVRIQVERTEATTTRSGLVITSASKCNQVFAPFIQRKNMRTDSLRTHLATKHGQDHAAIRKEWAFSMQSVKARVEALEGNETNTHKGS